MTTTQKISAMIVAAMQANGGNLQAAVDSVLGEGSYMKLAGEVYHQLRSEN